MTDRVETDGWLHFIRGADTVKVYCESIRWKPVKKPLIYHYDAGVNLGIPVFKEYIIIIATGIWIDTNAKIVNYLLYLDSWLDSGSINVKVQRTIAGAFEKLDGTNQTYPMMFKNDLGTINKISNGDQTVYFVDKILLEQTGTAS